MSDKQLLDLSLKILDGSIDATMDVLIPILTRTNELYRDAESESFLSDNQYDLLYRKAEKLNPFHEFFVGSGVTGR
jgi:hypothetical protein